MSSKDKEMVLETLPWNETSFVGAAPQGPRPQSWESITQILGESKAFVKRDTTTYNKFIEVFKCHQIGKAIFCGTIFP